MTSFNCNASFLSFCWDDLPIGESGIWKLPTAIPVLGVICAFRYISTSFIKLSAPVLVCAFLRLHYFLGEVFL